ncbi:MAG: VWA domain-containing protein [Prevotellaceae bacterium]|nr:VWA domain-containing protein [Prevotellaceae bacterium]
MFRFAAPEYLYLLILIPLCIGAHLYLDRVRRKKLSLLGDTDLLRDLMPLSSERRRQVKFYLVLSALLLVIVLLARPQTGSKRENVKRKGIEVIVALDVSNSMLAQDISPNRLENAKMIVTKLIDNMNNDKIGLVVFAGDAYTQIPITSDYVSAKMFMPSIKPSLIPVQGTAIGTAIDMAMHSFGPQEKTKTSRAIVVITDGENHEDDAVGAAQEAVKEGINVSVIGMGRVEGAPIPIEGTMSFMKDRDGAIVVSKLNEAMCMQIADAGKGVYVRADNSNTALKLVQKHLDSMAKSEVETAVYSEYGEQFQLFAVLLLLLLFIEIFILEIQNKWLNKIKLFE